MGNRRPGMTESGFLILKNLHRHLHWNMASTLAGGKSPRSPTCIFPSTRFLLPAQMKDLLS